MSNILSQNEVNALLEAIDGGQVPAYSPPATSGGGIGSVPTLSGALPSNVFIYDFKRPERVSKDQMRTLETMHGIFARNVAATLSGYLRAIVEVRVVSVEQLTYAEFILSLPNPTCFNLVSIRPLDGEFILELNPSVVFPIVDRLLGGGKVSSGQPERALTEIEWGLINNVINRMLSEMRKNWEKAQKIDFQLQQNESNPQIVQANAPNEPIILITFEVTMGEISGMMNLCIPSLVIDPVMPALQAQTWLAAVRKEATEEKMDFIKDGLALAPLAVITYAAETTVTVRDLLGLKPGDVIETSRPAQEDLLVMIEKVPKFRGTAGIFRGHKALKVTRKAEAREAI